MLSPYLVDYAKTERSKCVNCGVKISIGSLRFANKVESLKYDGSENEWHHFDCFFENNRNIKSIDEIDNFYGLRNADQKKIKDKIYKLCIFSNFLYIIFFLDPVDVCYSKAENIKCVECEIILIKGEVILYFQDEKTGDPLINQFYHVNCFLSKRNDELWIIPYFDINKLSGLNKLFDVDRQELVESFSYRKSRKRLATNNDQECSPVKILKEDLTLESKLTNQNDLIWKLRDQLYDNLSKKVLVDLLKHNEQYVPPGITNLAMVLSDRMLFGCINKCPQCNQALTCNNINYKCHGIDEWSNCSYETREVDRFEFKIPEEYRKYDVLKEYNYVNQTRLLYKESIEPLKGYELLINEVAFEDSRIVTMVKTRIRDLGGVVADFDDECNHNYVAIISTSPINNQQPFMVMAKERNIDVVTHQILDNLEIEDFPDAVKTYNCVDWGRTLEELRDLKKNNRKSSEQQCNNNCEIVSLTMKKRGVVDPDSGLVEEVHIYRNIKKNELMYASLVKVNIVLKKNSFYKIQLLESDTERKWWLFQSWGRTSATRGFLLKYFSNLIEAKEKFEKVYQVKTGNEWFIRELFKKSPNKYYPVDVDYEDDIASIKLPIGCDQPSKLPIAVERLMSFIFDLDSMKKAILEFEIDLKRMPFGKLSKNQLDSACKVLIDQRQLLNGSDISKNQLIINSNKFYSFLPHDSGRQDPPLIDSLNIIKKKFEMIEDLREIEVAFKILETEGVEINFDNCYIQLHNNINVVEKDTEIFNRISLYLKNTHAKTHSNYKLEIIDIFDLAREDEDTRFLEFSNLPNHMMLWHGSFQTRWADILSQGLDDQSWEEPLHGNQYGNGIYFTDMVAKAVCYCHLSESEPEPEGILMLCEVFLGNMAKYKYSDTDIIRKEGENSCHIVGNIFPDPSMNLIDETGVLYPMGTPILQDKPILVFNEYLVYNKDQVRQRYLVRVKINND